MKIEGKVAVIGVGTMGEAIIRGIRSKKLVPANRICGTVRTESRSKALSAELGLRITTDNAEAARGAKTIILCLKPQNVIRTLDQFAAENILQPGQLVISIAAGVRVHEIEEALPYPCPVIRAMPNTPCSIGRGTTVFSKGARAGSRHLKLAHQLFDPLGATLEIEEKHMDTVTGLSGSGPAFGYLMVESLADGGVMMGLPRDVATTLAARSLLGAAEMVLATGLHPASLKDDVTTPAGCTIAGILALEDGRIRSTLARGVQRATEMASQLGEPK